jgi:hypothetical protein
MAMSGRPEDPSNLSSEAQDVVNFLGDIAEEKVRVLSDRFLDQVRNIRRRYQREHHEIIEAMTAVPGVDEDEAGDTSDSGPPSLIDYEDSSSGEEAQPPVPRSPPSGQGTDNAESNMMRGIIETEDVGTIIVRNMNLDAIVEKKVILLDSGANKSIVNAEFRGKVTDEVPCKGVIVGSDPTSTKGRITAKGYTKFLGRDVRVYRGNVPSSVFAVVTISEQVPLSFSWRRGVSTITDDETGYQVVVPPTGGLTVLPDSIFM